MNIVAYRRTIIGAFPARRAILCLLAEDAFFTSKNFAAIAFYPSGYSIFTNAVSNLGNTQQNTVHGWIVFSLGMWSFGITALPMMLHVSRRLASGHRLLSITFRVRRGVHTFFFDGQRELGAHVHGGLTLE